MSIPDSAGQANLLAEARAKAALFPGASLSNRVTVLMKAGRIPWDAMPYVLAHLEAVVAAEREACARLADAAAEQTRRWKDGHDSAMATPIAESIAAQIRARGEGR